MMIYQLSKKHSINGLFSVPGDKSLTHRAIIIQSLVEGETTIKNASLCNDCLSTIRCMQQLGIEIEIDKPSSTLTIKNGGMYTLKPPESILNVDNSATTLRMLAGILAAQPFATELTGDISIQKRPMERIITPLTLMGAKITSNNGYAPLKIEGKPKIKAIKYTSQIASAQVKSAILFSGLYIDGETIYTEPAMSRNHTENMLKYYGASITSKRNTTIISGNKNLIPLPYMIGGDFSSAAYLMVLALVLPNSDITITNVNVNFTRIGLITALKEMGGNIEILNKRTLCGEPVADIRASSSMLHGIEIGGNIIPRMIDEIPVFAVAALTASGTTVVKDAQELRYKESDRIRTLTEELKKMGGDIEELPDGMIIHGGNPLKGARVASQKDHRIALSLAVAAAVADETSEIQNWECIHNSFPAFKDILEHIQ